MRPRLALALVLSLGLAPLSAHAADRPAAKADRKAYATAYERLAHRLKGLDPQLAKATAAFDNATLVRGADFDGDGEEEVVDVRSHAEESGESYVQTLRLDVRRGRDGKLLWSKTLGPASYVFPLFAKTGAKGGMGIVAVEYEGTGADGLVASAGAVDTTVTSYDGKGTQLWTHATKGAGAYSIGGGSGVDTYVDGIFDANPGGGSEVLLTQVPASYVWDPIGVTEADSSTVVTAILDGATGQARQLAPVATTSGYVYAQPVPDLDKDGREDVVVAGATGTTSTLWALKSSDGSLLWACRDLPGAYASFPLDVGDVTGDKVPDVAVAHADFTAFPLASFQDARTTMVDGAKGTATWTKTGYPLPLGNADRKPGNEIALGDWLEGDDEMGFAISAVNGAGNTVWKTRRAVSLAGLDGYMAEATYGEAGDTGPDGVNEIGYAVRVTGKGISRADEGTINGRTGKALRDPVAGMYATRLAFDGRGSDAYKVDATKPKLLRVATYRGDTGRKLWETVLPVKGIAGTSGTSLFAGRDKCADLAVVIRDGGTTTHYVLSGATGKVLWAVARSGSGAGRITHPAGRTTTSKRSC